MSYTNNRGEFAEPHGKELLTLDEVAALVRVDPRVVLKWGKKGNLTPCRTSSGQVRYIGTEVRDLIEQRRTNKQRRLDDMVAAELYDPEV